MMVMMTMMMMVMMMIMVMIMITKDKFPKILMFIKSFWKDTKQVYKLHLLYNFDVLVETKMVVVNGTFIVSFLY